MSKNYTTTTRDRSRFPLRVSASGLATPIGTFAHGNFRIREGIFSVRIMTNHVSVRVRFAGPLLVRAYWQKVFVAFLVSALALTVTLFSMHLLTKISPHFLVAIGLVVAVLVYFILERAAMLMVLGTNSSIVLFNSHLSSLLVGGIFFGCLTAYAILLRRRTLNMQSLRSFRDSLVQHYHTPYVRLDRPIEIILIWTGVAIALAYGVWSIAT